MRPLEALNDAIIQADARGDVDAVNRLYAMRNDPAAIGRLLLALDSTPDDATKFADMAQQFGCVFLPLIGDEADSVLGLGERITQRDLHEKGLEWEPHVTALHGVHDEAGAQVQTIAKAFGPLAIRLGKVGVFPATPDKPYDVLKIAVDSPDLMAFNRALKALPHTESYGYNPHVTIGYLKPGRGQGYANRFGNFGKEFTLHCVVYSDALKRQTAIPLGATSQFADWKPGNSPVSGEAGYISSGGQFRKQKPEPGDDGPDANHEAEHKANVSQLATTVTDSLANEPELKDKPGLLAKVQDLALTGAVKVMVAVQRIQDHWTGKAVAELVDAYFDSPNDMKKLGYNPGNSSGTASPKVHDAVSNALNDAIGIGMSGHLVAKIAAEVLSRGFIFLRNKFKGGAKTMADGSIEELSQALADIYNEVNKSLGLDGVNDPKQIAQAITALKATPSKFAEWKPGQSAEGQSGWVSSGGQFRHDKPASADEATVKDKSTAHVSGASLGLPPTVDMGSLPAAGAALGKAWRDGGAPERAAVLDWAKSVKMDPRLEPAFTTNLAKWADVPHKPGEKLPQMVERAKRKADFISDKPKQGETPQAFAERHYPELKEVKGFNVQGADSRLAKESVHDAYEMLPTLKSLSSSGTTFHIGDTGVPTLDEMQHLAGVAPRGWPPGSTWDQVAGCYNNKSRKVVAGGIPTGCVSLFAHEAGHGIGHQFGIDDASDTIDWHKKLHDTLPPYLQQGGPGAEAGRQELVAESIAVYYRQGVEGLSKWNGVGVDYAKWLDGKMKQVK